MPGEPAAMVAPPPPERSPAVDPPPRVWTVPLAYVLVVLASVVASAAVVFVAIAARELREPGLAHDEAAARDVLRATLDSVGVLFARAQRSSRENRLRSTSSTLVATGEAVPPSSDSGFALTRRGAAANFATRRSASSVCVSWRDSDVDQERRGA